MLCQLALQTPTERELSAQAATALTGAVRREAFPKAAVDVYVCVLEADGAELATAITAGAAALADAGIPMTDLVSACSLVGSFDRISTLLHNIQYLNRACFMPVSLSDVASSPGPQHSTSLCRRGSAVIWCWTPATRSSTSRRLAPPSPSCPPPTWCGLLNP